MSNITAYQQPEASANAIALPEPRTAVHVRVARSDDDVDLKFVDALQKEHSHMVGFLHRQTLETNIAKGDVLIAETPPPCVRNEDGTTTPIPGVRGTPLGYCIAKDRYFKRDDVGIIYQLNVKPTKRRSLIGASLVQATFERAAYGCRLFCCWCAQDLQANHFWESIGFVPLAFRTGSRRNGGRKDAEPRIHIFWQRRIREGDTETPYWFPSETSGGALRENRIALPIPPGTHWSDAKPAVLPGIERMNGAHEALPAGDEDGDGEKPKRRGTRKKKNKAAGKDGLPAKRSHSGLWFAPSTEEEGAVDGTQAGSKAGRKKAKRAKEKKPKQKNDPQWIAAARELRDRYIEEINAGRLLPPSAAGKYDVCRALCESRFFTAEGTEGRRGQTGRELDGDAELPLLDVA